MPLGTLFDLESLLTVFAENEKAGKQHSEKESKHNRLKTIVRDESVHVVSSDTIQLPLRPLRTNSFVSIVIMAKEGLIRKNPGISTRLFYLHSTLM